eukprot:Opistho-2@60068
MFGTIFGAIALVIFILRTYVEEFFRLVCAKRKSVSSDIVLVTGAGSGIGRLTALGFARHGATVVLWDINGEAVRRVADEVRASGKGRAVHYQVDLSRREDVYAVAAAVKRDVGDVTILVNNAGIVTGKPFLDSPDHLIEKTFQVNTVSHFWTVKAFLPAMLARNRGHVVTVASSAGTVGVARLIDYCSSKFGAVGFDEALRMELSKHGKTGVKTTVVCPYFIRTGMFDGASTRFPLILPFLEPEYVADKIVDAVRTNQAILMLPRILYVMPFLRGILPTRAFDAAVHFLGANDTMDDFKGRGHHH